MPSTTAQTTFVCGATGTQGGALASHLLSQGLPVHCLARNVESPNAKSLISRGARVWSGSYDDVPVLREALSGCTTVFLNFNPQFHDLSTELRWAQSILSIAKEAGASHAIFSSSLGSDDPLSVPGLKPNSFVFKVLESKNNIEKEVMSAKHLPKWTIFRPANFMCNYILPNATFTCPDLIATGTWRTPFTPSTRLALIDTETMGKFTSAAVTNPDKFNGQAITYADEIVSVVEMLETLKKVSGRQDLNIEFMSEEEVAEKVKVNIMVEGQTLLRNMGPGAVNLEEVSKWGVELSSFDRFLEREKSRVIETYKRTAA